MTSADRILRCRIESCDERERFPSIQAVNRSDWTEISPFSIVGPDGAKMQGYCPGHSEDDDKPKKL